MIAAFILVTSIAKKALKYMFYIYYFIQLYNNKVKTLLNNKNEINIISPNYAQKLGLKIGKANVKIQKIDGFALKTFGIVIADF